MSWNERKEKTLPKQKNKAVNQARRATRNTAGAGEDRRPLTDGVFRPGLVPEGSAVSPPAASSDTELCLGLLRKSTSSSALVSGISEENTRVTQCMRNTDSRALLLTHMLMCFCVFALGLREKHSFTFRCWCHF